MYITCLDVEGVLVPEIWIAFAEASGIPELKKTTRDEPDYAVSLYGIKYVSACLHASHSASVSFPRLSRRTS